MTKKIEVSADALYRLLKALNGAGHEIRELQATRNPILEKIGGKNPINSLTEEYNEWARSYGGSDDK